MEVKRSFVIFSFLFVSFLIWQEWKTQFFVHNQEDKKKDSILYLTNNKNSKHQVFVKTDVLDLVINMYGGDIEEASLINYKDSLDSSNAFKLLETKPNFVYQAQSGLIGKDGPDNAMNNKRPLYYSKKHYFVLNDNQSELRVPITWTDKNHVVYVKTFIFQPKKYTVKIEYSIYNSSQNNLELRMFGQLKQTINLPEDRNIYSKNFALQTFRGAAYSSMDSKYEKYKFDIIANNKNLYVETENGWIAMLQQYFTTAWIPNSRGKNIIYTTYLNHDIAAIGYKSSIVNVSPHSISTIKSTLWIGPDIQKDMALVAPNLDLTVDYGWLWFLSQPLFKLLSILYTIVGNWGFSIILITFIMRAFTYPLTKAQYISMAKMRILQPRVNEIKKTFKKDKKRMSQEIISLYQKEKINPIKGFLPVLIQMPIFLSLYYMLIASVELRHAPFLLWIHDLSSQDPYYVMPLIMGLTMFIIQKVSSANNSVSDPLQKNIMHFIPVIFTVFFLWFPSGLVLYYIMSNLVTIIQQKFIFASFFKKK